MEGSLVDGLGFGVNLPYLVGDTQVTYGSDPLRSPHNSHDDVLARMGLIGLSLWVILWLGWYWQLVTGCRRLARRELHARRQVAVLCIMVVSTILMTSYFSPQLEGAQIAALQWTAFGVGIAVTSSRGWFGRSASTCPAVPQHLIQPVLAGPKPREREVIELSLWHDLYDDALAIRKACPVRGGVAGTTGMGSLTDDETRAITSPSPGTRPMIPSMPNRMPVKGRRKASSSRISRRRKVSSRKIQAPRAQRPEESTISRDGREFGGPGTGRLSSIRGIKGFFRRGSGLLVRCYNQ